MSLSLSLGYFFHLEAGQLQGLRPAGYIPTLTIKQIRSERSWNHSEVIKDHEFLQSKSYRWGQGQDKGKELTGTNYCI